MTHLTADEQTTLDEAWRASTGPGGSFLILLDVVEGMVSAHRDEAVVMADLAQLPEWTACDGSPCRFCGDDL